MADGGWQGLRARFPPSAICHLPSSSGEEVFAVAAYSGELTTPEPANKSVFANVREDALVTHDDARNALMQRVTGEVTGVSFDFRKFRHAEQPRDCATAQPSSARSTCRCSSRARRAAARR